MARKARVVVPGVPHHVTQRGNRRQPTFFAEEDYALYKSLMAESCAERDVEIWAYCLMPNHTHMILVPAGESGLRGAIGEAHRRYTVMVNSRYEWTGYLWQGRFASYAMDPGHLYNCARYVELNPVRSGLVKRAQDWRHSSARAHLVGRDDAMVQVEPLLDKFGDWRRLLRHELEDTAASQVRQHARSGLPMGDEPFLDELQATLGCQVRPGRPGRPRRRSRGRNGVMRAE